MVPDIRENHYVAGTQMLKIGMNAEVASVKEDFPIPPALRSSQSEQRASNTFLAKVGSLSITLASEYVLPIQLGGRHRRRHARDNCRHNDTAPDGSDSNPHGPNHQRRVSLKYLSVFDYSSRV